MAPQASQKCGLLPPDHRISSCTSTGVDSDQVPGAFSVPTISLPSPRASVQSEKRFLTPFLSTRSNYEMVSGIMYQRCRKSSRWVSEGTGNSYQTRRAQMKIGRSLFTLAFVSLMYLGLLVLGVPVLGFAQVPHPCKSDLSDHQGQSLGGVSSFNFVFAKDCGSYTSSTTQWRIDIYQYGASSPLPGCSWGPFTLPPNTQPDPPQNPPVPLTCSNLPKGPYPKLKVVIGYQAGSLTLMYHTHYFGN